VTRGKAARTDAARSLQGRWEPATDRPDPIALLEEQAETRLPELIPIRHGRMSVSPFTFYRGAALIMAADLAGTPTTGLTVQTCGDAHLSNFGVFASPERQLLFDVNDFDETLPGPWEWDVKRFAASLEVAGRDLGFRPADRRDVVLAGIREYREEIRRAARMGVLEAWYAHMNLDGLMTWLEAEAATTNLGRKEFHEATQDVAKARTRDSVRVFTKLAEDVEGEIRIVADPPLIVPVDDLVPAGTTRTETEKWMRSLIRSYRRSLGHQHHPVEEFRFVDSARKVVGVGSVGTRCWIFLLEGRDGSDPLVLQAKEAQPSVLERFVGPSEFRNHAKRIVMGQRLMQAASDIFLGWLRARTLDGQVRDFYVRQLHDWKGSVEVDTMRVPGATLYARLCGSTLARAHARSGDRIAIAAYLGKGNAFDRAMVDFSVAYADQNERDYETFVRAVDAGRLEAQMGP
jgi:uncharacterized protein (DUF2252 family)